MCVSFRRCNAFVLERDVVIGDFLTFRSLGSCRYDRVCRGVPGVGCFVFYAGPTSADRTSSASALIKVVL